MGSQVNEVLVRQATDADVPRLVEMGTEFLRAQYRDTLTENPDKMRETAIWLIGNPLGRVLVAENGKGITGMIAFLLFPHFFSGELVAGELIWYAEPDARGKTGLMLLRRAEQEAAALGAKRMQMISPSQRTDTLYLKLGYAYVEAAYQRNLA